MLCLAVQGLLHLGGLVPFLWNLDMFCFLCCGCGETKHYCFFRLGIFGEVIDVVFKVFCVVLTTRSYVVFSCHTFRFFGWGQILDELFAGSFEFSIGFVPLFSDLSLSFLLLGHCL